MVHKHDLQAMIYCAFDKEVLYMSQMQQNPSTLFLHFLLKEAVFKSETDQYDKFERDHILV